MLFVALLLVKLLPLYLFPFKEISTLRTVFDLGLPAEALLFMPGLALPVVGRLPLPFGLTLSVEGVFAFLRLLAKFFSSYF
jgi:hypothetical protein